MSKGLYTLIRFMGKVVAYIVVLVAIVGGTVSYLEIGEDTSSVNKVPQVKFSDFEEYKNMKTKSLSKKEIRALQDKFKEEFFTKFELISKNISIYADATKQAIPRDEALEELLFSIVSSYSFDMRTAYLSQLVTETSNLVSYSEVVATDKTKTNIQWTDFLDWFTTDFEFQLDGNNNQAKYITIEASAFEKAAISAMVVIVIMLGLMMSLLLRRDAKANPVPVATPAKTPEPSKSAAKTETIVTKAPLKKKPVAKKNPVTKKDTPEVKKNEVKKEVKKDTPEVKPTGETK